MSLKRLKRYKYLKQLRQIRDEINKTDNSGRAERLLNYYPNVEYIEVIGRWTVYVTLKLTDGYEFIERAVHEIDALKNISKKIYNYYIEEIVYARKSM